MIIRMIGFDERMFLREKYLNILKYVFYVMSTMVMCIINMLLSLSLFC